MFRTLTQAARRTRLARWGLAVTAAGLLTLAGSGLRADPPGQPMPKKAPPVAAGKSVSPKDQPPKVAHPPMPPAKPLIFKPAPKTTAPLSDLRFVPSDVWVEPAPPGSTSQPVVAEPAQGRFRVTLRGFSCEHQTRDDLLENDGAGDEVIVRCWTRVLDGERVTVNQGFGPNGIFGADDHHGDGWQRFLPAGSANIDHGGIGSGNRVTALAGERADRAAAGRFPITVFEGTLVAGRTVAVIVPTLWEWDDFCGDAPGLLLRGESFPTRFWTTDPGHENDRLSAFESAMTSLTRTDRFSRLTRTHATDAADTAPVRSGASLDLPTVRGDMGGNRGIGSVDTGDGIVFQPRALVLNYAVADRLARTGRVPVSYLETEGLDGAYTVYLHVERLP